MVQAGPRVSEALPVPEDAHATRCRSRCRRAREATALRRGWSRSADSRVARPPSQRPGRRVVRRGASARGRAPEADRAPPAASNCRMLPRASILAPSPHLHPRAANIGRLYKTIWPPPSPYPSNLRRILGNLVYVSHFSYTAFLTKRSPQVHVSHSSHIAYLIKDPNKLS